MNEKTCTFDVVSIGNYTKDTIVNAAGPFVDELNQQWGLRTDHRIVYSKGIHLVVSRDRLALDRTVCWTAPRAARP